MDGWVVGSWMVGWVVGSWTGGWLDGWMVGWITGCLVWKEHKAYYREDSEQESDCDSAPHAVKAPETFPAVALGE